jgi:putative endonuclease
MKKYYIYILTNYTKTTLYIGVTDNIQRRFEEHKEGYNDGFSNKYKTHMLVYVEVFNDIETAIEREKQLKNWNRQKKNSLINSVNPEWNDLSRDDYFGMM